MAADGSTNDRRRGKSALFVVACGWAGLIPHWLDPAVRLLPATSMAVLLGGYSIYTVLLPALGRSRSGAAVPAEPGGGPLPCPLPPVDVVAAARDEQAVITRLVERIAALRYPAEQLRLWVVDDGSADRTPQLLAELQGRFPFLRVLRREPDAGGGKSGALNLALQHAEAPWMLVLDADADLQPDTLERLIPWAVAGGWGAVQLRKAVANAQANWLTRAQAMEMALDAVIQEGRLARGGVVELRGNGQLLRRDALQAAGGFNEATVTDDLDLSFRLLLHDQPTGILWDPPVREEAVLSLAALWRQRQRWAEGGLQRFFDYGPGLFFGRVNGRRRLDLLCFFLLQYAMPMVAMADLLGAALTLTAPTIWPLSFVAFGLSGCSILLGCRRGSEGPPLPRMAPWNLALGIVYLGHWFVVIPWTSLRMALLPKRLVWAKTLHLGESGLEETAVEDPAAA
ncbi:MULTISPECIES: glycosyltransferase [Aphanothece]|uniref:glycosyltransferase n=1 Tax=Aphanothece TaxID=1121 RepID=UPI003984D36B